MKRYLLDTNILSNIIKNPQGHAANKIRCLKPQQIMTSIIVASELQFGIQKKASAELSQRVEGLLERMTVLDLKMPVDIHYGEIRLFLQKKGTPIGPNDLFIAAQALAENLILVTDNTKEFERVQNLVIENWL